MNRRNRRAAAKAGAQPSSPPSFNNETQNVVAPEPGLLLRLAARLLLSPMVLNRIQHPDVERALISLAIQARKPQIAKSLENRIAMRKDRAP